MVHNNFFDLYKDIIERQKREGIEDDGIKWITYIDNDKDSIEIVKTFLNARYTDKTYKKSTSNEFFCR